MIANLKKSTTRYPLLGELKLRKSKLFTLALAALIVCSLFLVGTQQVKAAGTTPTNYNLGFLQTTQTVAMSNNLIVVAVDANNATVSYSGAVTLTCSDPQAILPTNTVLTITNGFGGCSMYFGTAGSQSVTVTDTTDNSITGTLTVTVAPMHFGISVTPTSITAGQSVNVTVTALDASNNVLTTIGSSGYGSSIDFSSTDNQAVFPLQGAPSNLVNGVGIFNITLNTAGSQTITATNKAFTLVSATTPAITVNPVPTTTPAATPTPTASPTPTPTTQPTPTATVTATPTAQTADNGQFNLLIIVAVIIVIAVVAVVAVVFLRKRRSPRSDLPPPPPPPP